MNGVVLIVDDSAELRDAIEKRLRQEGYDVLCAPDGDEALALMASMARPAVVIVDHAMPGMDGADFVAQASRHRDFCDVPIIMLSGDAVAGASVRGVFAFLRKPCVGSDLVNAVGSAFASLGRKP